MSAARRWPLLLLFSAACTAEEVPIAAAESPEATVGADAGRSDAAAEGDGFVPFPEGDGPFDADLGVPSDQGPQTDDALVQPGDGQVQPGDGQVQGEDAHTDEEDGHPHPDAMSSDAVVQAPTLEACDADPLLAGIVADDEGWGHVAEGAEVAYTHEPPASGPHYGQWVRSGVYEEAIDRRNWVHNLEHGWMVLLYRPDAPAEAVAELRAAWEQGLPDAFCPESPVKRIVVTPYPGLPTAVAAVTAYRVLSGDRLEAAQLARMFELCRVTAPEVRVCADGSVPAPPAMP